MPAGKKLMKEIEVILNSQEKGLRPEEMLPLISRPVSARAVRYAARSLALEGRVRPNRNYRPDKYYGLTNAAGQQKADA
jgi:hypothetical protein